MPHYIGKISVGLQLRGVPADAALQWQQQVERFCYDRLLPALDRLFDQLAGLDEMLTIDKLDLDLRGIPAQQWEEALLHQVLENVENQIQRRLQTPFPEDCIERRPVAVSYFDQWLYFLEHGTLPPGQAPVSEDMLRTAALETVAAQSRALNSLLNVLHSETRAFRRLLWQHDEAFLDALLEASVGSAGVQLLAMRSEFEILLKEKPKRSQKNDIEQVSVPQYDKLLPVLRQLFQEKTWKALAESHVEPTRIFKEILKEVLVRHMADTVARRTYYWMLKEQVETHPTRYAAIAGAIKQLEKDLNFSETPANPFSEKEKTQPGATLVENFLSAPEPSQLIESESSNFQILEPSNPPPPKPETSDWYVRNAGVVLLHPYLSTLFKALGFTNQGRFDSAEQRGQAVRLLHYVTTGQTDAPEFDLIFEKFLCGWDIETPMERPWKLENENWKNEVETLLQAAIKNWGKLGNASSGALRENFLRRPGKLSYRSSDGWRLRLEPSGIDILLNYLPWGIGMVKLPWMKDVLNVEWTS
jgi:hypothetical protein